MLAIEQSELANLVREIRERLESQVKLAAKLGVSFQSVNRACERTDKAIAYRFEAD